MDRCGGHANDIGMYHYHGLPNCLYNKLKNRFPDLSSSEILLGVALDGFPIYGPTTEDLDTNGCNGRFTDPDKTNWRYHVSETRFPYILGCYVGEVSGRGKGIEECRPSDGSEDSETERCRDRPRRKEILEQMMQILKRDKLIEQ